MPIDPAPELVLIRASGEPADLAVMRDDIVMTIRAGKITVARS